MMKKSLLYLPLFCTGCFFIPQLQAQSYKKIHAKAYLLYTSWRNKIKGQRKIFQPRCYHYNLRHVTQRYKIAGNDPTGLFTAG